MLYLCILCGWTSVSVDAKQDDKTAGRYTLSLDGGEWHLWQDKQAEWKNDKLFLPEDATDLSLLPVNVPTGGWEQLNPANAQPCRCREPWRNIVQFPVAQVRTMEQESAGGLELSNSRQH